MSAMHAPRSHAAAAATADPYNLKPGEHSTGTTIMGEIDFCMGCFSFVACHFVVSIVRAGILQ